MTPQSSHTRWREVVRVHGESAAREPQRSAEKAADLRRITALRRELADAEHALRAGVRREAAHLAHAEHAAWREARDACHAFDRIRPNASARLEAIRAGSPERFPGERALAEMALREADRADAAYTVISFAKRRDRRRYLRGGDERKAVIREAIARGGVFTEARGGKYFQEILR
jgi:monoamine oxidase